MSGAVLGQARRVVVTKDNSTIIDGAGDRADVEGRVNQIKAEIEKTDADWDQSADSPAGGHGHGHGH